MSRGVWRAVSCLGLMAGSIGCAQRLLRVSGTVLGHGGVPISVAHVAVLGEDAATPAAPAVRTSADGSYTAWVRGTGLIALRFTGVNHAPETVQILVARPGGRARVDVTLAVPDYADDFSQSAVIGDFNGFQADDTSVAMEPLADGRLTAQLAPGATSTVAYQVINATRPVETINSTHPGPPIPGTDADSYVLRDDGYYAALVKTGAAGATAVFDPARLPRGGGEPSVSIRDASNEAEQFAAFATAMRGELQSYTHRRLELKRRSADEAEVLAFVREYDWARFHRPIREALDGPGSPLFKQAALVVYLDEAGEAAEMSHSPVDRGLAHRALLDVPPSSSLWSSVRDAFPALTWANFHAGIDGYDEYFDRIITTHPDGHLREAILSYALSVATYAGEQDRAAHIYERLVADFPESRSAANAKKMFGPDRRVRTGRPVPDFRVAAMGDSATVYTRAGMLGKVYLIDFWAAWCGPCLEEMPHLHRAFERYKATGFTILSLSCDESADKVRRFRGGRWPMPWLHGLLEHCYRDRDKNDLVTAFEVGGFPSAVLVGADGTILEVGSALRGERLAATLARVLDPRASASAGS